MKRQETPTSLDELTRVTDLGIPFKGGDVSCFEHHR
jgi:hypothetical protein